MVSPAVWAGVVPLVIVTAVVLYRGSVPSLVYLVESLELPTVIAPETATDGLACLAVLFQSTYTPPAYLPMTALTPRARNSMRMPLMPGGS